jgi:hypothetical protein
MDLNKLQKAIEKIGKSLPPKDDWIPALIIEGKEGASIFGFAGDAMFNNFSKDVVAKAITNCIAKFKPDCACFVTTAWSIDLEKSGIDEFDLELWKAGAMKIADHPDRVEIVNAYYYSREGPEPEEALMIGYIQRYPDKGPTIRKWKIIKEGASAEGRFPDAVKGGFDLAKGG